jgi:maltooligosyltrehalose trehalohydrolase
MSDVVRARRLPVGADLLPWGGASFRVWAPAPQRVDLVLEGDRVVPMEREADGYWSVVVRDAAPGTRYRYRLDGGDLPDPASRFQPEGPHGPSVVVDPAAFAWTDRGWAGARLHGAVLYEMHVGTFTPEGTWAAAARHLPALAELGVNVIELMPVAEFPGRFGWGYDGVDLFAPTHQYGEPDDMRRFVDDAHRLGIAVILDVVYNHFGPDGCYLRRFSPDYFSARYVNEWGEPVNFDGERSGPVRELILANAAYWVEEFHLDGYRVDATQQTFDASPDHIVAAITRRAREAARGRGVLVVAENEPQEARFVRHAAEGGHGMDCAWNDDFHHAALVALTGRRESYYTDYAGTPQELVSGVKHGYLYQGQRYAWQDQRRGTSGRGLTPAAFVTYLENHDQVANSALGRRLHQRVDPGRLRAITALLLLAPQTPLLFQGQEFAASAPFLYFADHEPELAGKVEEGRRLFLSQFRTLHAPEMRDELPVPHAAETFARCKLDHGERVRNAPTWALHRDLLRLRREDPRFSSQRPLGVDGAVIGPEAFVLRFFDPDPVGDDRLLLVNLGLDILRGSVAEPLLASPDRRGWRAIWSSEDPRYGGTGTPEVETDTGWRIPGHAAVVLAPAAKEA